MTEPLGRIPAHPRVELDYSILVDAHVHFADVAGQLDRFQNELLKQIRFVGSYEGKSVGEGKRSLTFKIVIGCEDRTLVDEDTTEFCAALERHLSGCGFGVRR